MKLNARRLIVALTAGSSSIMLAPPALADTPAVGQVVARGSLIARLTPSTHTTNMLRVGNGVRLNLNCKVPGTVVDGNKWWYLLNNHVGTEWVSARYMRNIGPAPEPCDPSDGYHAGTIETRLNVREGASNRDRITSVAAAGTRVKIQCWTNDTSTRRWLLTSGGRWLSAAYVETGPNVRYCRN